MLFNFLITCYHHSQLTLLISHRWRQIIWIINKKIAWWHKVHTIQFIVKQFLMVESDSLSIPFITIHNCAETTFPCHFKQSEMISSSGARHGFVFSFSQLVAAVQLLQLGTQNQTWRCVFGILGRKQTTFSAAYTGFNILDTVDRNMEYGDQD